MALSMGTNGVRALFDELDASAAMDLGFGFAQFVKNQDGTKKSALSLPSVVLARDMRLTSPCLFQAAAAGLMEGGVDVQDCGIITAPAAEWVAHSLHADGLIIVTASHNPPEWNALKFVDGAGLAVSRERGAPIAAFVHKPHTPLLQWQQLGKMHKIPDAIPSYQKAVLSFINRRLLQANGSKLKVIADPGNGTSTLTAPAIFKALGVKAKFLHAELDGRFPNRLSEPAQANVGVLIETVSKQGADFGVAWDGDADRVTFVDDNGRWLTGDIGVALSVRWALLKGGYPKLTGAKSNFRPPAKTKRPIVVTTSATSRVVEAVALEHGAQVEYTDIGAPYLSEAMASLGPRVISGGEEVGGIVWPKFTLAKDGVLASLKLLEMICQKPLSEWVDELPKYSICKLKVECPAGVNVKIAAAVQQELGAGKPYGSILRPLRGGFRLDLEEGWVLVRASGTENYVRIFAEGKNEEEAKALAEKYASAVRKQL
ncbi:Phosphoglucomutase/phosphomannomutase [uncultured archaeon]|nr:Phosphoglucomutase/phosphomannomutase [uncultured archaeon]